MHRARRATSLPHCIDSPIVPVGQRSASIRERSDRYLRVNPRVAWAIGCFFAMWCVVTTLLMLRLTLHVDRVERDMEDITATQDEGVQMLIAKWRGAEQAVQRQLRRLPLVSAAWLVVAPHLGWIYALAAPHIGPLRAIGKQALALSKMLWPLVKRAKQISVLIDVRQKLKLLIAEWSSRAASATHQSAGAVRRRSLLRPSASAVG